MGIETVGNTLKDNTMPLFKDIYEGLVSLDL